MKRCRLAVIGAGHLGTIHAQLASQVPELELVAIVDPDRSARAAAASHFSVPALPHVNDLTGLVDAVVVATPATLHFDIANRLMSQGIHCFVEKPLACTAKDAWTLVQRAQSTGVVLQVGQVERFNPAWTAARHLLSDARFIEVHRVAPHAFRAMDVGVILDLMIHDIDLLLSIAASDIAHYTASGMSLVHKHEDLAYARIEFQNGLVAQFHASRLESETARMWTVVTNDSIVRIDLHHGTAEQVRSRGGSQTAAWTSPGLTAEQRRYFRDHLQDEVLETHRLPTVSGNAIEQELREFARAILARGRVTVDGSAAARAVTLAEQLVMSLTANRLPQTHLRLRQAG